jgi:hypothetical protein
VAAVIQACWRGKKTRDEFRNIAKVAEPPVSTVRKFLHLLDQSEVDFAEELQLHQLKEKLVKAIRGNHELEHELNEMDIKIGLLVRNRIELQDVVKQSKALKKSQALQRGAGAADAAGSGASANLKLLTKDARERLEMCARFFICFYI